MPIIQVHLLEGRSTHQKRNLVADMTAAVTGALGVKPDQVRIIISEVNAGNFAVAGQTLEEKMALASVA